ncbi:ATP-dependent metallopeptidase FtsH/Yme1/Tma family protein [Anaerocolumna xylanovorans]|uniref:ATP-dependent zinc metalloprotease FtsH n=1 Tax=Anaerocolumna xylanovorans DSM 12503 TaxID=1121345 RepID=A0A1M7XZV8_9FIRM|nr:ATP-dependent metallopeptidase FtsH/Yme1/Tma family protein [Anaerocolumna xylanovorans]SHO44793.1 cell division protease FtsH [Anaerocolumna xylanovorans DSM 12503]
MKKIYWLILGALIIFCLGALGVENLSYRSTDMTYPSFLQAAEKGQVNSVTITPNGSTFHALIKEDGVKKYIVPNPKTEDFTEYLLLHNIKINYTENSIFIRILQILFLVAAGSAIFFFIRKNGNDNKPLISDASKKTPSAPQVTFSQIAGNTEAKLMVEDIISFIKDPEKYISVGARMPKGVLLYGPPGTGKTLMAKAIAGEAGVPFYAMSGSDFVQMYVGVGASRVRSLFNKAKKSERAVIFIDEIDAIGKKRARSANASNDERDQTLNALLTEMSGFNDNNGIIVIGATNRLDTLDDALLRPGRFDRQIEIGLPDVNARKKILGLYAKKKPLSDDVDLDNLAKSTVYFSGAMLENLLNEAAINAANEKKSVIDMEHVDKAFYTVIAGAPVMDRSYISERDKKITAYHEAGHALVTKLLTPDQYISKVTIIPSVRGAGGFNLSIPKDTMFKTKQGILSEIMVLLGGRASEELIFGKDDITTGASNDIEKASTLLYNYMNRYGMDEDMGMFSQAALEDTTDKELLIKCRQQMKQLYEETKILLRNNLSLLERITKELLEKESLNGDDIDRICA